MKKGSILVAGANGYIGSVLTSKLSSAGYNVYGIDTEYYSDKILFPANNTLIKKKDVRSVDEGDLRNIDTVICLADLNDPTSQLYPAQTKEINLNGLKSFANKCKQSGVRRFLYSSSASVYGFAGENIMDENSKLNPLTVYAECKVAMEKHLSILNDNEFSVACMRNATVYGLSPHMRFDLVVNYLCGSAVVNNVIRLKSDGSAWRPFVHIEDLSEAFLKILRLPKDKFSGLIVNIGNGALGNYRIIDIARLIQEINGGTIEVASNNKDNRSYRLNTAKLEALGISCSRNMRDEIENIINFLRDIRLDNELLHNSSFNRTSRIKYLIESRRLSDELYWR